MRRVFLVGLVALVAMAANCCPPVNCQRDCPVSPPSTTGTATDAHTVEIVVLPIPVGETATCVTVDRVEYCAPRRTTKELPNSGDFTIYVDGEDYLLDAYSPSRAPLRTVYVIVGSKYVVGVYGDERIAGAADAGTCVTCSNGATVCGHNPRCK